MVSSTDARANSRAPIDLSKVATCKIHPGIGIARVGNSPEGCFIGPEVPIYTTVPPGGYKDPQGRVKRQAARFRIYGYDEHGNNLGELPIDTHVDKEQKASPAPGKAHVVWKVHLANK